MSLIVSPLVLAPYAIVSYECQPKAPVSYVRLRLSVTRHLTLSVPPLSVARLSPLGHKGGHGGRGSAEHVKRISQKNSRILGTCKRMPFVKYCFLPKKGV